MLDHSNGDRYMNVGNPTRSLALADVRGKDYLPVDDKAWEQGVQIFLGSL